MVSKALQGIFLLILIGINLTTLSQLRWDPVDLDALQTVFDHSQYCVPRCEFWGNIDDPELYTLVGVRYLEGADPGVLNPEVQPLAKYFFGLSTLLLGTALPAQLLFGLLTLLVLYVLSRRLLSPSLSLIPPLLLSLDPLFQDQLSRPFVDLTLTFFVLLSTLFLLRAKYAQDWWWGALSLGALALTKSFSIGLVFAIVFLIALTTTRPRHSPHLILRIFALALLTYLLGYLPYFLHGHSLFDFALLHLDIIRLYKSYVPEYPKGEIFRLIFTAQWRTWWGDRGLIPSPFHTFLWPLNLLATLPLYLTVRRQIPAVKLLLLILTTWLGFISLRLVFPRYLLPILPVLYALASLSLTRIIRLCLSRSSH